MAHRLGAGCVGKGRRRWLEVLTTIAAAPPFYSLRNPGFRYNKEALRLRIFYLLNQPAGAESHTVLLQVGHYGGGGVGIEPSCM